MVVARPVCCPVLGGLFGRLSVGGALLVGASCSAMASTRSEWFGVPFCRGRSFPSCSDVSTSCAGAGFLPVLSRQNFGNFQTSHFKPHFRVVLVGVAQSLTERSKTQQRRNKRQNSGIFRRGVLLRFLLLAFLGIFTPVLGRFSVRAACCCFRVFFPAVVFPQSPRRKNKPTKTDEPKPHPRQNLGFAFLFMGFFLENF